MSIKAHWTIELIVNCPKCGTDVDLAPQALDAGVKAGEYGTEQTTDTNAYCPFCQHEFIVTVED